MYSLEFKICALLYKNIIMTSKIVLQSVVCEPDLGG